MRVKGIKRYFEPKSGRTYCYHRASGKRLTEEFGSPEFFARLAELEAETKARSAAIGRPQTLRDLILDYKSTDNFKDLATRTRSDYEKIFTFLKPLWNARIGTFTTPQLVTLRNKWRATTGRRTVNYARAVLSILFNHAKELGLVDRNPVRDLKQVRKARDAPKTNRAWDPAEREAVMACFPPHLKLPVAIGLYTGLRQGDVLRLPRNIVSGNRIAIITNKRLVPISIDVLPDLRRALADAPRHDAITLCANSRGQPWTGSGFRASFFKQIKKLEEKGIVKPGLTFHGLRHTVASILTERGVSPEDIAALLGQRSSEMAKHYSQDADRTRRASAAIRKLTPSKKRRRGRNEKRRASV